MIPGPLREDALFGCPQVAFDAILAGAAKSWPDRVALRDGDRAITFSELFEQARRAGRGLREAGIERGDLVALHMPNSIWFPCAYFAVLAAGAIACPVNPAQPERALAQQLDHFDAAAVVTHPACAERLGAQPGRLVIAVPPTAAAPSTAALPDGAVRWSRLLESEAADEPSADPGAVAHLQLTGGTTGHSKGVRVLHRNLVSNIFQASARRAAVRPVLDDGGAVRFEQVQDLAHRHAERLGAGVVAQVSPYFHGMGLVGQCANTALGVTVLVEGRFDAGRYLAGIEKHGVTRLAGSTAFYQALVQSPEAGARDLSSVVSLSCGGSPVDTTTLDRLRAVFPNAEVMQVYGLSEATCTVTMPRPVTQGATPADSAGVPVAGTRIEIRAADGVEKLPAGESGEIWVRGPQVTDGYHREPGLTAEQFRDGWLRTGDLGRLDEASNLFVVGRAKDMIIYKGYNVYPAHLEEILGAHPAVARSAVVGMPRADVGEIPVAFVVPGRPESEAGDLGEELMAYVAEQVAPYQRIRAVRIVDELPLSPTGKILKRALREMPGE